MFNTRVYEELASLVQAYKKTITEEWKNKRKNSIEKICTKYVQLLNEDFKADITLDLIKSKENRLVLHVCLYLSSKEGWCVNPARFSVIVEPSLAFGCELRIVSLAEKIPEHFIEILDLALCGNFVGENTL